MCALTLGVWAQGGRERKEKKTGKETSFDYSGDPPNFAILFSTPSFFSCFFPIVRTTPVPSFFPLPFPAFIKFPQKQMDGRKKCLGKFSLVPLELQKKVGNESLVLFSF